MDISLRTAVRLFWQVAPITIKTAILNLLHLSQNAAKQSLKTEVLVVIIRTLFNVPNSIGKIQALGNKDPGIKGQIWISKVTIPAPTESDTLDHLLLAVKNLDQVGNNSDYILPRLSAVDVEAEWTGPRGNVTKDAPRPELPEQEQYQQLVIESPSDTTILYFHGGGYIMMDPSSHRLTTRALAKHTSGRVLSVRYRLAPQHPFPSALLDALHAYLYLISPPPGSFHTPIKPQHVVFAGDSAGGGLATSLLLLLLHLHRTSASSQLRYHNATIPISTILPAGIALNSPYLDITHSLPSVHQNAHYDYLSISPTGRSFQPIPDKHWPTSPPRADLYAPTASLVTHPLISPITATPELWTGSPPVWMCVGEEMLLDAAAVVARTISRSGPDPSGRSTTTPVVKFLGWEGMPHCFAMLFPTSPAGRTCIAEWARFVVDVTQPEKETSRDDPAALKSGAWWYHARQKTTTATASRKEVSFERLSSVSDEEMQQLLQAARERTIAAEDETVKMWQEQAEGGGGGRAKL